MNKEILDFINQIKSTTGLDLKVYTEKGKSVNGDKDFNPLPSFALDGYAIEQGKTFFRLNYNMVNYFSVIDGDGATEKSLASVIVQLAKSLSKEEVTKQGFVTSLLSGDVESAYIKKHAKKFGLIDKPSFASLIKIQKGNKKELLEFLDSYCESGDFYSDVEEDVVVFIKVCDDSIGDYSSCAQ
jgi:hypothetical protein